MAHLCLYRHDAFQCHHVSALLLYLYLFKILCVVTVVMLALHFVFNFMSFREKISTSVQGQRMKNSFLASYVA